MEEFIARENIRRFKAQIDECNDEGQRAEMQTLLDAERRRLRGIREAKITQRRRT